MGWGKKETPEKFLKKFKDNIEFNLNSFADFAFLLYLRSENPSDSYAKLYQLYLDANNNGERVYNPDNQLLLSHETENWNKIKKLKKLMKKKSDEEKEKIRDTLDQYINEYESIADKYLKTAAKSDKDVDNIRKIILNKKDNKKITNFQNLHTGFQRQKVW